MGHLGHLRPALRPTDLSHPARGPAAGAADGAAAESVDSSGMGVKGRYELGDRMGLLVCALGDGY